MTEHLLKKDSPIYNLQVFLRLISQKNSNIPSVLPDGYYGEGTVKAVTAFQNVHGLPPTGITDNATWNKIVGVYEEIERENNSNRVSIFPEEGISFENDSFMPTMAIIQTMLKALSEKFSNLIAPEINGEADRLTMNALITVQKLSGLEPDGNITPRLWNVISALYEAYISSDRLKNIR